MKEGVVEDIVVGYKYLLVLIREKVDSIKIRIFDCNDALANYKDAELPFQIASLPVKNNLVMGKAAGYFIFN